MTGPHIALSIPELLIEILEYLSVDDLAVAALVCKNWLVPAVDTKWRTQMVKLSQVLANLAPIGKTKARRPIFTFIPTIPISHDHWNRFLENYANRISRLILDVEFDRASIELISGLLEKFGGHFGANLTFLDWPHAIYDDDHSGALIDPLPAAKLQKVKLKITYSNATSLPNSFSQLALRAPQISQLDGVFNSFDFSVFHQLRFLSHGGNISTLDYHRLTCHSPASSLDQDTNYSDTLR
ncbi:hypothetical protein FRB94_004531 [Tulasnella sp. JGI-2019a]|nr:hypothetical protein FRB94_004531 [Tulasnella sp. JGI-2019a]